jgi:hypothetical protein
MEYIHKAKAEKTRTKVLGDQMEARRIKNMVCNIFSELCSARHDWLYIGYSRSSGGTRTGEASRVPFSGVRGTRERVNIINILHPFFACPLVRLCGSVLWISVCDVAYSFNPLYYIFQSLYVVCGKYIMRAGFSALSIRSTRYRAQQMYCLNISRAL